MADEQPRARLGRGLAALLADTSAQMPSGPDRALLRVPLAALRPNPRNPRQSFDAAELEELAASVRQKGVIQPILVRPDPDSRDGYEIIAGERRWRAARLAGLSDVPVNVVEANDGEALELAIIENVQRADLNPMDEARGYERLGAEFGYTHGDLAKTIGKSRSHVANTVRLLKLPASVSDMVVAGSLTAGHARALLGFDDPESVARRIVAQGLTVRDVEELAQRNSAPAAPAPAAELMEPARRTKLSPEAQAIAQELSNLLGLAVTLDHRGLSGGELRIRYKTTEQLHSLCRQLRS